MNVTVDEIQRALAQHYRVERELGAGGMATVYLAHDPKHDRRVAIKVLRPELAAIVGGERFLKEIRTTANLQHPHILPLHDSGEAGGLIYYVMPYVEGESLRQRLKREKQLPVDDAIRIAREVAGGLDYAHRHGVVHRDIKPENILLHDGQALVADFGIALAVSRSDGGSRMTETGMSLGTPHYMSPEQAMGEREITPKSDVYALGCVLYEMLAGEPPFTGPTPQAIIARVVTDEPRSLTVQRRTVPPHVERAVMTALAKLPADRFASAAQFAEAIATAPTTTSQRQPAVAPTFRRVSPWLARSAAGVALIAVGAAMGRFALPRTGSGPLPARLSIRIPPDHRLGSGAFGVVAISPDGATIAYAGESGRGAGLYVRRLDDLTPTALAGTEGASNPVFAFDGQWIDFVGARGILKVSPSGGTAIVSELPPSAAIRSAPNEYVATGPSGALGRSRNGGPLEEIARPDSSAGEVALIPLQVLPDGRILTHAQSAGLTGAVALIDPASGKRKQVTRELVTAAWYHDGFVAWVLPSGVLVGAKWDPDRNENVAAANVIAPNVRVGAGQPAQVAFSRSGSLVYVPDTPQELVRVSRTGARENIGGQSRRYHSVRVSPNGRLVAVDVTDDRRDVWLLSLADETFTRTTFENDGHDPQWMPDGRSILFASARGTNGIGVSRRRIDGSGRADSVWLEGGIQMTVHAVTRDGSTGIAARVMPAGTFDLVRLPLDGKGKMEPITSTRFSETHPALSPDGRWLAYVSDESGRLEVYVRPVGSEAGRIPVSQNGGQEPVWSRNGRELFYYSSAAQSVRATLGSVPGAAAEVVLMAAVLQQGPELRVVSRTRLFDASDYVPSSPHANYDVTPDGRFVFIRSERAPELIYIQNWTALLRQRAP